MGMPSRKNGPPSIWDTHGRSGNVFANPTASSSAPYPQESNPWISNVSEHTSPHVMNERQTPTLDPRCQSGPSARNSFNPSEGRFSKNYRADQQRLQISDPHFDKFSTSATFACWKIRFKTEVCTCSQFPTEALLWIKEVEMVESVDDLKSSCSIGGIRTPDFEVLDAKIASALNRIIHNTRFKKKVSLEEQKAQKEDRFLRGRQIAYLIYEYFRVTGADDSVENNANLFTMVLQNDDIQEFDSKWDEILLSMTQIPSDDILEGLYKLRIRESEKLKTVLELYNMEIHQRKAGPDYHRLKTMEKRSIEQNLRIKNFEARNGNYETERHGQESGTKQREQRTQGDCWQWKPTGSVPKETTAVSGTISISVQKRHCRILLRDLLRGRMREMRREPEVPRGRSPSGRMSRLFCKDYLKGTCTNSFCEKWHPPECLFYKSENGCRFGEKCSNAHRQVDEQPSKRSKKNGDRSAVAMLKSTRQLGCVFQDVEPPKSSSILWKSSNIQKPIRCVQVTKAVVRHADIRDKNPSLGMICPSDPHQRKPNAPKFEDRSQEETEWQERWAREAAWRLAKSILKFKEKNNTAFFSPSKNWCLPAPSTLKPEERESVVDFGALVHMISKKDLNSAEMGTLTTSRTTTVITANGEVQTHEEATVYVKELEKFLTMKVLEDTPAVLSLGKLCDEHGYSYEWINGQKPHLMKNGIRIQCNTDNFVPIVVPGLSTSSSSSLPSSTSMTPSRQKLIILRLPQARLLHQP